MAQLIDNDTKIVNVGLGERAYDIFIGARLTSVIVDFIKQKYSDKNIFIVSDDNVYEAYTHRLIEKLGNEGLNIPCYKIKPGEESKSLSVFGNVLGWLAKHNARRDSLIIAVGGGVIGDLVGFVASSYMRGIDFIQVPTTLLAQVDSSVGGKTAINIDAGKNLVGAFYQPKAVFCDFHVFKTLPDREIRSGYAEVYKYGLLWDREFKNWLDINALDIFAGDFEAMQYAIARCCEIKAEIVAQDEREGGVRALLNLGHTFGHALEALCQYDDRLRHGEAVSIGMCMAADLSVLLGLINESEALSVRDHLKGVNLLISFNDIENCPVFSCDDFIGYVAKDKKAEASRLVFVVLESLGKAVVRKDIDLELVKSVINKYLLEA